MFDLILLSGVLFAAAPQVAPQPQESGLSSEAPDEMGEIDALIRATQESLERQKNIRVLLEAYRTIEKEAVAKPEDAALLFRLADSGKKLHEAIEEAYLADYFSADFMAELRKLKDIADKKPVPPAK
jgi:hypothetical protein